MTDEEKTRGRGTRAAGDAAVETTRPTTPVAATPGTRAAGAAPLDEDDSAGRTKVPVSWLLEHGERTLGIPRRDLVAALQEQEDDLTLNAARKAVERWRAQVQNPDVAAEEA